MQQAQVAALGLPHFCHPFTPILSISNCIPITLPENPIPPSICRSSIIHGIIGIINGVPFYSFLTIQLPRPQHKTQLSHSLYSYVGSYTKFCINCRIIYKMTNDIGVTLKFWLKIWSPVISKQTRFLSGASCFEQSQERAYMTTSSRTLGPPKRKAYLASSVG